MFTFIKRYSLIFFFVACSIQAHAQSSSIEFQLKAFYNAFWNQENFDLSHVESYLSKISESDIVSCSDSTNYYYHYLSGGVCDYKGQIEHKREHFLKAIALREKSLGILDPEYIELLWALGSIFKDVDVDKAISYYQKAIVIGETILYNKEVPPYNTTFMQNTYGMVISDLARMYEKKDWRDRVAGMYEGAFSFRSKYYDVDDATCYVDLYLLARYYKKLKEYDKVVETYQRVVNYIKDNGGYGTDGYVNASYMLAAALSLNGQCREAEKIYSNTIKLTLDSLGADNKNLDMLYSNYCIEMANNYSFNELYKILPQVRQYYFSIKSVAAYVDILYTISSNLYDKKEYDKADVFIDSLLSYPLYIPDTTKIILYSQKSFIEFEKKDITSAILWKQRQIDISLKMRLSDKAYNLTILSELATLYSNNGNYNDALSIYQQVLDGLKEENLEEDILYEQCVFFVCNLYHVQKKVDLQETFLNTQKAHMNEKNLNNTCIYAQICNYLSVIQMQSNRLKEAFKNNNIAENLFFMHYGRQSVNYATALHNKGRILMLQGKNKQALKNLQDSRKLQMEVNGNVYPNTDKYIQELEKK